MPHQPSHGGVPEQGGTRLRSNHLTIGPAKEVAEATSLTLPLTTPLIGVTPNRYGISPLAFYTEIRSSKDEEPLTRKRKRGSMSAPAVVKGMAEARLGWRREHNVLRVGECGAGQGSTSYSPTK